VLIPARRTEAARIETGWLSGWLGWQSLAFQTLGADPKEGGVQVAAPFARPEEVSQILRAAGFPQPPGTRLVRPPPRALIRRCGPWLLLAALIGGAGTVWQEAWWAVPVPLAVAILGFVSWLRAGHGLGEDALYVSGGIMTRRLWIIPFEKLQTLSTRRTPLERLLNLASLVPDTAGAALLGGADIEDLPRPLAEQLAARLLELFYAARARVRGASPASH
jgi:uncharacterized membrane protein YdbT with pleckstrin-like domain